MKIPRPTLWGSGSVIAGLTMAVAFAACSDTTGPASEIVPDAPSMQTTVAGEISVCKDGPAGTYSFEATVTDGPDGTFPLGTSFDIAAGDCAVIFTTSETTSDVLITETDLPSGVEFDRTEVVSEFADTEGTFGNPVTARANVGHGSVVTFFNVAVPHEEPHEDCVGLTPGFWRNWANHYTQEEFESLLATFGGISAEDATEILSYGGPDPVERLRKFVLANELTLALTESDLPNPDDASLSLECEDPESGMTLGDALDAAADILMNPENFDKDEINAVKDALDNIANLPVEEEE